MTPKLLAYLCDPIDKSDLELINPVYDRRGHIVSGELRGGGGATQSEMAFQDLSRTLL